MSEDQPPPKSKVARALTGLAMCVCSCVVAFEVGMHSLCGPRGAISYGGGSNAAGIMVLISVIVIPVSALGAVACLVWLLVELTRGR